MDNNPNFRYFIFSQKQMDIIKSVDHKRLGRDPKFGFVVVNGTQKIFTAIVRTLEGLPYSDYRVVASGDITKMIYKEKED